MKHNLLKIILFKKVLYTEDLLIGHTNYKSLIQDIYIILEIHSLGEYVHENLLPKIEISKIKNEEIN